MTNNGDALALQTIAEIYTEAFSQLDPKRLPPEINVRFYPYIGINHTIRIRDGRAFVRIAEICHDMPLEAQRGLAYILVGKLLRKKASFELREPYEEYVKSVEISARANHHKRTRGRKVVTGTKGEIYDLDEIFDSLNFWYFDGRLQKPTLTWSPRKSYHILGHHDSTHETISISRSLDSNIVPRFVAEYVLFHEMLHIAHPTVHHNGRRYHHTPAFKRDERRFAHYNAAEKWIEENVGKLRRAAKRKRSLLVGRKFRDDRTDQAKFGSQLTLHTVFVKACFDNVTACRRSLFCLSLVQGGRYQNGTVTI